MYAPRINPAKLPERMQEGDLLLTPSHRLQTAITEHYRHLQPGPVARSPRVMAVDVWARDTWRFAANAGVQPCASRRLLYPEEEQLLWEKVIDTSLDDTPLLNPSDTAARAAADYHTLYQWWLDGGDPLAEAEQDNAQVFRRWAAAYKKLCKNNGLVGLVDGMHELITLPQLGALLRAKQVYRVNFSHPPPLYEALFKALKTHCQVQRIDTVPESVTAACSRREYAGVQEEIRACADWLKGLAAQSESQQSEAQQKTQHIGIITVQDEDYRQRLTHQLGRELVTPVIPKQQRLVQQGVIHCAQLLLQLNRSLIDCEDFCRLLHSPYIVGGEREQRVRLETYIRDRLQAKTPLADLVRLCRLRDKGYSCPSLGAALSSFKQLARSEKLRRATAHQWCALFRAQLKVMHWPAGHHSSNSEEQTALSGEQAALSGEEVQSVTAFHEALDKLSGLESALGLMTLDKALAYLHTLCSRGRLRPKPERDDSGVQISLLTLEEAASLQFDKVWLLGFDDRHWPPPARPSPFLPHILQRRLGLPHCTPELQHQYARDLFNEVHRGTADTLICSHYSLTEDQEERRGAAFAAIWPLEEAPRKDVRPAPRHKPLLESVADTAPPLQPGEQPRGGHSLLSHQSLCPFRGFAQHRLGTVPLPSFEHGLSPALRGEAMHQALSGLFTEVGDSAGLQAVLNESEGLQRLIEKHAELALDYLQERKHRYLPPRFRNLEKTRLSRLLHGFVTMESSRPDFTVLGHEEQLSWHCGGLDLNIRMDRMDRMADGKLAVIDYKSGKGVNPADWRAPRLADMQLPVYFTACSETKDDAVGAAMIAQIHLENTRYVGEDESGQFHGAAKSKIPWDDITTHWRQQVHLVAEEFLSGQAAVTPVNRRVCKRCGLQPLCRIDAAEDTAPAGSGSIFGAEH